MLHVTDAPAHSPADYGELFPGTHDMLEAASALGAADGPSSVDVADGRAKVGFMLPRQAVSLIVVEW